MSVWVADALREKSVDRLREGQDALDRVWGAPDVQSLARALSAEFGHRSPWEALRREDHLGLRLEGAVVVTRAGLRKLVRDEAGKPRFAPLSPLEMDDERAAHQLRVAQKLSRLLVLNPKLPESRLVQLER